MTFHKMLQGLCTDRCKLKKRTDKRNTDWNAKKKKLQSMVTFKTYHRKSNEGSMVI